jgi:hypothetical protein
MLYLLKQETHRLISLVNELTCMPSFRGLILSRKRFIIQLIDMKSNQLTLYHCVGNGLKRTDAISLSHQETTLHCLREQGLFVLGANVRINTLSLSSGHTNTVWQSESPF